MEKNKYFKNKLKSFGLFLICIFSLCYVVFLRVFAEINIKFSFFDFPVFVGEILLVLCFILSVFLIDFKKLKPVHFVIGFFCAFFLAKAFLGYHVWGPLAFRHAALFYYTSFFVFGYLFYRKGFFSERKKVVFILSAILIFIFRNFYEYWAVSIFILTSVLILSLKNKSVRLLFSLLLLVVFPYKVLFMTSRTFLLSQFLTVLFAVTALFKISKVKRFYKIGLSLFGLLIASLFMIKYSSLNAVSSIFNVKETYALFKEKDLEIKEKQKKFVSKEIKMVSLYNPNEAYEVSELIEKTKKFRNDLIEKNIIRDEKTLENNVIESESPAVSIAKEKTLKNDNSKKTEIFKNNVIESESSALSISKEKALKNDNSETIKSLKISKPVGRNLKVAYVNSVFRLLIWRDMIVETFKEKALLGIDFGRPLRSNSLEVLDWGSSEWMRDGWIEPHNSYLNVIYRAGVVGLILILVLIFMLFDVIRKFIILKSVKGILLSSILIGWFVAANFLPILELPYTAILIWSLFGMTIAYLRELRAVSM